MREQRTENREQYRKIRSDFFCSLFTVHHSLQSERGQVLLGVAVLFTIVVTTIILGLVSPIIRQIEIGNDFRLSRQSYFAAEALGEDLVYRFKTGKLTPSSASLTLGDASATAIVVSGLNTQEITSTGTLHELYRVVKISLQRGTGISFNYAIQSGEGGFELRNSSSISGNVYSAGPVFGAGNVIRGGVISSGPNGIVWGIHATSSVYAHSVGADLQATIVDKDAYYATSTVNTTVSGASHPGSPDQPTIPLPISDSQISEWEGEAAAGGTISSCDGNGDYTINSNTTLGPKKITCNLIVKNTTLTVTGPLWVVGDITTVTNPTIKMDPSLGSQNVAIIADNPGNQSGSGVISINQGTIFEGSGSTGSYVFMISQNNSAETGGTNDAITLSQSSTALVAYASHGQITLSQSANASETTGYKILLTQSAEVTYDTGLPSTVFDSGPSGGYAITSWQEVQ
ncbi:MAG TPA: hypothetical protein VJG64_01525 [Candidatus Paceibacterota bacterium]